MSTLRGPGLPKGGVFTLVTFADTVQYPSPCIAKKAGSITIPRLTYLTYSDQHRFSTNKINT